MELDLASKTLFAEFSETVRTRTAIETAPAETKTFVKKKIKGKDYWYEQRYEGGQARQTYFGPSNSDNDKHVASARQAARKDKTMLKKLLVIESRQAAMLRKSGLPVLDRRMALLLRHFSEAGLIHRHGVLVGTLAYVAYTGLLGNIFDKSTLMTQDIDIARDDRIKIATPPVDLKTLFSERGMECREVPSFSKKALPSSYVTSDGIRIDLLVPLRGKVKEKVLMPSVIGAGATALRFLDYLIEEPVEAILLAPSSGVIVTVPRPERFAIHKLIVAAYRSSTGTIKKDKDIRQASQLIEFLAQDRREELKGALHAAMRGGKKWEKAVRSSLKLTSTDAQKALK